MDVAHFLNERLGFIRQLYATSAAPFVERQRLIENEEEPFVPPYAEDGEPPFLTEWQEAQDSIDVLGHACLCLLTSGLQAYLQTRHILHGPELTDVERKNVFRHGWVRGYNRIFTEAFGIPFADGPVSIDALEDIVLARNSIQHQLSITSVRAAHADRKPGQARSFFLSDREVELLDRLDPEAMKWVMPPAVHVDQAKLEVTLDTVARFVTWLDGAISAKFSREV
ncbi:hypothetical protein SAMN05216466_106164 [Paraburkholderia phenazinium]|uniref:RiboL-PSP-HEPN domain-containing protein n=1 Tax=Paraburkholderia phenazinium TaxID=60549 RepID=A0A1G7YFH6_9BURK|nr:hypothetical protein [Paraburkholderia phenazinium]SDG95203.1 hypothetical protein SAMN05216466_106164 [Paraburkholderia phenazinium]